MLLLKPNTTRPAIPRLSLHLKQHSLYAVLVLFLRFMCFIKKKLLFLIKWWAALYFVIRVHCCLTIQIILNILMDRKIFCKTCTIIQNRKMRIRICSLMFLFMQPSTKKTKFVQLTNLPNHIWIRSTTAQLI